MARWVYRAPSRAIGGAQYAPPSRLQTEIEARPPLHRLLQLGLGVLADLVVVQVELLQHAVDAQGISDSLRSFGSVDNLAPAGIVEAADVVTREVNLS